MSPRALVVEDDDRVLPSIEDTLFSMRHEHRCVTNLEDARRALHEETFDYALLDLQIPARPGRGGANIEFGKHLLEDIRRVHGVTRLPVIVMTAYSAECLNLTKTLTALGANEFIAKPFPSEGRTLADVIRQVTHKPGAAQGGQPQFFAGGELDLFSDHAELLGVQIIGDSGTGQALQVLRELSRKQCPDRTIHLSAEEIGSRIDAPRGVATVTGCIYTLRSNIETRLRASLNIVCQKDDVIANDNAGYYYREWITVRDRANDPAPDPAPAFRSPRHDPAGSVHDPATLGERERWVLGEMCRGVKLTRRALQERFEISEKTAKRVLGELVQAERIEFVRTGRDGYYRPRKVARSGALAS